MPKKKERKNGCSCKVDCPCHKSRTVQNSGRSTAKVVESQGAVHWLSRAVHAGLKEWCKLGHYKEPGCYTTDELLYISSQTN